MNWEGTVATILLGTERRPEAAESDLLGALALEATRRRAGAVVASTDFVVEHAPAESLQECPIGARQLLELARVDHFGAGSRDPLTALWVERCAAAGRIAPAALVPDLLDFGRSHVDSRPQVRAVIGERGSWMAQLTDNWKWFGRGAAVDDVAIDVVVARLRQQRAVDPELGRSAIVDAALGQAAADRALLYAALDVGLSDADEPLLEDLLDDRSRKVSSTAIELLSQLPRSSFAARMIARVEPLVTKRRLGSGFKLELPEVLDDRAGRDGITGAGDSRLVKLIAAVPLEWWERTVGEPGSVVRHAPVTAVRAGWIEATRRQSNERWAAALFDVHPDPELVDLMSQTDADKRLAAACGDMAVARLTELLRRGPHQWSPELSRAVAKVIKGMKPKATQGLGGLVQLLDRIDASTVDHVARSVEHLPDNWQRQVSYSLNRVRFRIVIDQEFT